MTTDQPRPGPELEHAIAEARYAEDRLSLYRAKAYRGGFVTASRLRELERARDGAVARLARMRDRA